MTVPALLRWDLSLNITLDSPTSSSATPRLATPPIGRLTGAGETKAIQPSGGHSFRNAYESRPALPKSVTGTRRGPYLV